VNGYVDHETVVNLIGNTTTASGLAVNAKLDRRYPTRVKVPDRPRSPPPSGRGKRPLPRRLVPLIVLTVAMIKARGVRSRMHPATRRGASCSWIGRKNPCEASVEMVRLVERVDRRMGES
jgi:hypothetical protein